MAEIIVEFNRTDNIYYKTYAKIVYSVSYSDDVSNLKSTATINMDFYIKPDAYTYSTYTNDTLYLGLRCGSSTATLQKTEIDPTLTYHQTVYSNTYNHVGSASFDVEYSSTSTYNVYLAACYTNIGTTRFSPFYMPQSDGSSYNSYSYQNTDANLVTLEKRINYTACTAPTTFSISSSPFGSTMTLSWSGAASGTANTLSAYEIQYRTSLNASTWSSWTSLVQKLSSSTSGTYTYTPTISEGYYIQYQIRAIGTAGSSWYSSWKQSSYSRKNSAPSDISTFSLSTTKFSLGDLISLTWSASIDTDSNIDYYSVQYSPNNGTWVDLASTSSTSYSFTPSNQIDDEEFMKFRVRAVDKLGYVSNYKESSTLYREDYSGVKLCENGAYLKAFVYVCQNGVYTKAQVYVCVNGVYEKGVN